MNSKLSGSVLSVATISVVLSILVVAVACGGGNGSDAALTKDDKSLPAATKSPAPAPTATPVIDLSSSDEPHETGIEVKEILLDPGEYGGKMTITIFNASDQQCFGPIVNFALLREDKSAVGNMGLPSGDSLDPGGEQVLNQRYVGIGVAEAAVTSISCDNSPNTSGGAGSRTGSAH